MLNKNIFNPFLEIFQHPSFKQYGMTINAMLFEKGIRLTFGFFTSITILSSYPPSLYGPYSYLFTVVSFITTTSLSGFNPSFQSLVNKFSLLTNPLKLKNLTLNFILLGFIISTISALLFIFISFSFNLFNNLSTLIYVFSILIFIRPLYVIQTYFNITKQSYYLYIFSIITFIPFSASRIYLSLNNYNIEFIGISVVLELLFYYFFLSLLFLYNQKIETIQFCILNIIKEYRLFLLFYITEPLLYLFTASHTLLTGYLLQPNQQALYFAAYLFISSCFFIPTNINRIFNPLYISNNIYRLKFVFLFSLLSSFFCILIILIFSYFIFPYLDPIYTQSLSLLYLFLFSLPFIFINQSIIIYLKLFNRKELFINIFVSVIFGIFLNLILINLFSLDIYSGALSLIFTQFLFTLLTTRLIIRINLSHKL